MHGQVARIVINGTVDASTVAKEACFAKLQLQKLNLKVNQLNNYKEFSLLWELPTLKILDLSQNNITKLAGWYNKSQIEELILNSNELHEDNGSIGFVLGLPHLITLFLNDNCIQRISTLITSTTLQNLSLADNYIERMEDVPFVGRLTQLRVLDMSRNELKNFFFQFGQLLQLRRLSLAENKIADLSQILFLGTLPALEVLHLQGNRLIGVMQSKLFGFLQLRELNLAANPALNWEVIQKLTKKMPQLKQIKWGGKTVKDGDVVDVAADEVKKLEQELTVANTEVAQRKQIFALYQQAASRKIKTMQQLRLHYMHFDIPAKTVLTNTVKSLRLNLEAKWSPYQ
jgi:hypothetical protein